MGETSEIGKPDRFTARLAQCFRDLRHQQGWSLDELTDRSGVSRATLSRLEHAEVSPTAHALARIADAYGMPVSRLIRLAEGDVPQMIPRASQTSTTDSTTGTECRTISTPEGSYTVAVAEYALPADAQAVPLPDETAETEYHMLVLEGRLTIVQSGEEFAMRKGDSLRFHGDGSTTLSTTAKRGARCLLVAT